MRPLRLAGFLLGAVVVLAAPRLLATSYGAGALVTLAQYVTLALAFDLLAGHVGAVSLASPAFYALGAYTAGILATRLGTGFLENLAVSTLLAAAGAVALGWPLFRLSDLTFAIGSLGLGLIAAALANNLTGLTGGAMCTTGVPAAAVGIGPRLLSTATPASAYYLALALAALAWLVYRGLTTFRIGRALAMIHGDETMAAAFGVHALRYKLIVFAASAVLTAAAGVFLAHYTGVVCPSDFSPLLTINLLVIAFIGGLGHAGGMLLGALLFVGVAETARGFQHLGNLFYGGVLLAVTLFMPDGVWGRLSRLADRARRPILR